MKEASDSALKALQIKLREKMNEYADAVALGDAPDFAEYKRMAGVIEGLALAERDLLDVDEVIEQAT